MALTFLDDPAAELYAPEPAQRAFTLGGELAARFAAACATLGDAPCDVLADLIALHCEDIEEGGA